MKKFWLLFIFCLFPVSSVLGQDKLFLLQDTCIKCHLWCESTSGENSVVKWKNSVHFRPDSACADCHGGDRLYYMDFKAGHMGVPDQFQAVGMCQKCHEQAVRDFIGRKTALPKKNTCTLSCVDCHGHHQIEKPDATVINEKTCGKCHSPDKMGSLSETIKKIEPRLALLAADINADEAAGLPILTPKAMLKDIKRQYSRGFHRIRFSRQEQFLTGEISDAIDRLEARLNQSTPAKWRLQGYAVLIFLGLICALLAAYQTTLKKNNKT